MRNFFFWFFRLKICEALTRFLLKAEHVRFNVVIYFWHTYTYVCIYQHHAIYFPTRTLTLSKMYVDLFITVFKYIYYTYVYLS